MTPIHHRTIDSPLGSLLLAATPDGLVRVAFEHEEPLGAPGRAEVLDEAARQLDEYFAGRRRRFDLALDLRRSHGFHRRVLDHLGEVEYGTTTTYTAVAEATGNPAAVRAVGNACATNPLPIVVPCHRVVRRDGVIGRYLGGTGAKRALLALEAAA